MRFGPAILLVSLLAPSWAMAQVYKCQDAYGRMVYSDVSCASNQTGKLIQRERSSEQKLSERQEAYSAQNAKQERRRIEEERAQLEREQYAVEHQSQSQAAQQGAVSHRDEAQRDAAMRSATTVMPGARGLTRSQREAALKLSRTPLEANQYGSQSPQSQQPPPPSVISHCAGGFCYDNQGGVYHQHGNGPTMTGPNGSTCIRTGTMVQC